MSDGARAAALAGSAATAALTVWLLSSARLALAEGNAAAGALAAGRTALPLAQLATVLLVGVPATGGRPLRERLTVLAVLAAAPLPLAGVLWVTGAASGGALAAGQATVAAAAIALAAGGRLAERAVGTDALWLTPALQLVGIAGLWVAAHALLGAVE